MAGGFLTLGITFQPAAVDQKNVRPAVVVEVKSSCAAPGSFDDVALGLLASVFGFGSQAGAFGNVDEVNLWRSGGCGMRLRGCKRDREYPQCDNRGGIPA